MLAVAQAQARREPPAEGFDDHDDAGHGPAPHPAGTTGHRFRAGDTRSGGAVNWPLGLRGFAAGRVISVVTAPVGVSGAVFLLRVLGVPSAAVTPTNLLYNVVAGPGALLRHARAGRLGAPLTCLLLAGTAPEW